MTDHEEPTETEIREAYHGQQMSMADVASEFGMTTGGIQHYFEKFGIDTRSHTESARKYTRKNCLEALTNAAKSHLGPLTMEAYNRRSSDSDPSAKRIATIFGNWNSAKSEVGMKVVDPTSQLAVDELYFEKINTHEKAYWLGFIYGDGHIGKNTSGTPTLTVCIHERDTGHLRKLKQALCSEHAISQSGDDVTLKLTNRELVSSLKEHGCGEDKTFSGSVPNLNQELKLPFIRGLVDADGSLANGSLVIAGQVNRLERIQEWIPFETYIYKHKDAGSPQLKVRNPMGSGAREWLYPDGVETEPTLERKKQEVFN